MTARCKREPLWTLQAPAAFGLVSFLMHAGLERNRIRKHLLVFALAAPVLAMLTFLGLSQVNVKTLQDSLHVLFAFKRGSSLRKSGC